MQESQQKFKFAGYTLDPVGRNLWHGERAVEVQNQVFDLLSYLVQHAGQVISKQTLLDEVWNNQFLTDATIAQAVKKARQAVGDDGQRQDIIRTIHGKGISLVVAVDRENAGSTSRHAHVENLSKTAKSFWIAAPILLLLATAMLWWTLPFGKSIDSNAAALPRLAVFPFENATGNPRYQWLEFGLAETVSLLLEQSNAIQVRFPQTSVELPAGELIEKIALLGARRGLSATVASDADQFAISWQLTDSNNSVVNGSFITADAATIARQMVEAVLNEIAEQPAAPIVDQPLLNDPLAVELYSRGVEAIYRDQRKQGHALLVAAQARAPDVIALKVAATVASFDPGNIQASLQRYRDLLESLPADARVARARLSYEIGNKLWFEGEMDQAAELLEQVLLETNTGEVVHAQALNSLAFVRQSQSQFDRAWENAKQAEMLMRDFGDPYNLGMVLTNLGYTSEDFGRLAEAGRYHQEALEIRQKYKFPSLIAASQYGLARIQRRSGNFSDAEQLLQQSLATVTELELPYDQFDNMEELAEVRMHQQQFEQARQLLDQAHQLAIESDDALGQAWSDELQVRLKIRQGIADQQAFDWINSSLTAFVEVGEQQDILMANLELAQLHLLADQEQQAATVLQSIAQQKALNNPVLKLRYRLTQAALQARQQGAAAALQEYQAIVREARSIGVSDLEAEAAIELGHLALATGDLELAMRTLAIPRSWSEAYYRTVDLAHAIEAAGAPDR